MNQPISARSNDLATTSLVLGLLGFLTCGVSSIGAIICGHIAKNQIAKTGESGDSMAMTGLILGYFLGFMWIIFFVLMSLSTIAAPL